MKILKQTFQSYKKNFLTLAFAQLMLFFSSLFFLMFVKYKLTYYLNKLREFEPQLQQVLNTVDVNNPATIDSSLTVIEALNSVTNEATLFAYIIVPLVLLAIWVLFQALFWSKIKEHKIKSVKLYLTRLAIPTIFILILFSQFAVPKEITDFFNTFDDSILRILFSAFIGLYLLTMYYAVLNNQSLKDALKQTFNLAIKKFYKFLPIYFPLFIISSSILWLLAITLTQEYTQTTAYFSTTSLIIITIVLLTISKFYKILLQKIVDKECGSKDSNLSKH